MMSQLVVDLKGATPAFQVKLNKDGLSPKEFQNHQKDLVIPQFGSQDLVRLAGYLVCAEGFRIQSFRIAYQSYHRLDPELEAEISEFLVDAYNSGGTSEVLMLLDGDYLNYVVLGVELLSPNLSSMLVQRHGILLVENGIDVPTLMARPWTDLQLR